MSQVVLVRGSVTVWLKVSVERWIRTLAVSMTLLETSALSSKRGMTCSVGVPFAAGLWVGWTVEEGVSEGRRVAAERRSSVGRRSVSPEAR